MTIVHTIRIMTEAQKAITEVRKYEDAIVGVGKTIEKHANTLSGDKLLKGANEWTAAVAKLGGATKELATSENILAGASKLTAAEKAKVNATVTEAIAKYQALGQTAPKAMLELRDATKATVVPTEALSGTLTKFASGARSIGVGLTAAVTVPIVGMGAAVVKFGMDAVESENLASVSFGNMKSAADEWAAGLSKNLGLNRFETEKSAATLFNMTTSMGIARDAAFKMSTGVVQLAADMASFRNIPMEEALAKIKSGLTGEAEPLKAIGILVNDATIKTYAYANGIAKQGTELTEQQKVMARYGAILQQTSNDQGDLARTMDSPANQLRIMRSRVEEAATSLGIALMPTIQSVIGGLTSLVPYVQSGVEWFTRLPSGVQLSAVAFLAATAALGPLLLLLSSMASSAVTLLPLLGVGLPAAMTATGAAGATAATGVGLLTTSLSLLSKAGWIGVAIGSLAALKIAYDEAGDAAARLARQQQGIKNKQGGVASDVSEQLGGMVDDLAARRTAALKGLIPVIMTAQEAQAAFDAELLRGTEVSKKAEAEAKRFAAAVQNEKDKIQGIVRPTKEWLEAMRQLGYTRANLMSLPTGPGTAIGFFDSIPARNDDLRQFGQTLPGVTEKIDDFITSIRMANDLMELPVGGGGAKSFFDQFDVRNDLVPAAKKAGDSFLKAFSQSIEDLPNTIVGAIQGGGNVMQAAITSLGAGIATDLKNSIKRSMGDGFMGSLVSGIVGTGVTLVSGLLGRVFGRNQGREDAKSFAERFGGFDALRQQMLSLGAEGDRLWIALTQNTRGPAQVAAVIKQIEDAFAAAEQRTADMNAQLATMRTRLADLQATSEPTWKDMQAAAERLGISLDQLGPIFQQQKLTAQATEVYDAIDTLRRGGTDMNVILANSAGALNELVATSLKTGAAIPENLKPMLQTLTDNGQLLDDNGEKMTDLAGLQFGPAVKSQWEMIADEIHELNLSIAALVEALGGGVEAAARQARRAIEDLPDSWDLDVNLRVRGGVGGNAPGSGADEGVPGFAGGTGGRYLDFGAGTLAMLHGRERVMTESEGRSGGNLTINITGPLHVRDDGDIDRLADELAQRWVQRGL